MVPKTPAKKGNKQPISGTKKWEKKQNKHLWSWWYMGDRAYLCLHPFVGLAGPNGTPVGQTMSKRLAEGGT